MNLAQALSDAMACFCALARSESVGECWDRDSALEGLSVGAVVSHVCIQTGWSETVVTRPGPVDHPVVTAGIWFADVRPGPGYDPDVHQGVVQQSVQLATRGHQSVTDKLDRVTGRLRDRLTGAELDRLVGLEPVDQHAVTLRDFVRTRIVEFVVHADDLAASVGVAEA
ncbi:MAG TPA: maleylpyruvate isomerase N-terminal domain-containing protein, partial [Mycobacteriales bacterium]|nr:maleylpyruvate isomerase N-terminal domain-containing protein [Mycobacteriales bacterium]